MKKNLFCSFIAAVSLTLYPFLTLGAENTDIVSVNVLNHIYYGTLTTDSEEQSTFTTLPTSEVHFSITGKWAASVDAFTKKCQITYEDGTTQSVTYKKGLIRKDVTTTYPDGTYQTFTTEGGKPCKKIRTYSPNDELLSLDWFHQCTPVTQLTVNAISSNYEELFSNPYDYTDLPVKVSGTVTAIYEASSNEYLKIKDEQNHLYLFSFPNVNISTFISSNIENVSVGDSIEIYGFFDSINDYEEKPLSLYAHSLGWEMDHKVFNELIVDSDFLTSVQTYGKITDSDLEKEIPIFNAFYWKTDNTDIDPIHLTFDYDEICKYPYYYKDEDLSVTGKVVYENISNSSDQVVLLVQDEKTSGIYGVTYKTTDYTSQLGENASFDGVGNGNCKIPYYDSESRLMGYVLYPNIKVVEPESSTD